MHACGHDFHTSVMLGAAHLLKAREAELPGTVRIFFQPAEETFNGARHLIDAGALDNVAAVFGLHNAPELPTGTFATRAGPFYANVDRFQIRITGKGAHAAKPEQGVDTIVTASQIVGALQTLPSRSFSSLESLVVSVTRIEGGNTWNVLPQTVELEGTVRTHSDAVRRQVPDKIRQVIDASPPRWRPGRTPLAAGAAGGDQRRPLGGVQQNRRRRSRLPGRRGGAADGRRRFRAVSASRAGRVRQHRLRQRIRTASSAFQSR